MSDLQCPARFLITRHGEATHPVPGVDAGGGGELTGLGRRQAADLAATLVAQRVAAVYASTMSGAVQTGERLATGLGVRLQVVDGLQEASTGESGSEIMRRCRDALAALSDLHRGETVVVVSHGGVMSLVLPHLAGNVPDDLARERSVPHCVPAELCVDGDGWRLVSWPGVLAATMDGGR